MPVLMVGWLVLVAVAITAHQLVCTCAGKCRRSKKLKEGYLPESNRLSKLLNPSNECPTPQETEGTQESSRKEIKKDKSEIPQKSNLAPSNSNVPKNTLKQQPPESAVQKLNVRKAEIARTQHSKEEDRISDVKAKQKNRASAEDQEIARTQQFLDEPQNREITQEVTARTVQTVSEKRKKYAVEYDVTQEDKMTPVR
ncbi:hypothetical protein RB195_015581 [Necator americanus]|uniref:Uncharacterized protein n=1 Tax=Necator americanus TaxID=51031 RepID=A0ABR1E587_NECAM